ncbi:GNAT family N-acetyltransferase [Oceanicola sp. S124]|uniref:GNAT family N-acetyltransferase n=1 Tax=Oceanicola sp. S124 TaxID=1042378 RepID=UPI0002558624|nr:GNAT family N-acetyltransferase [Oceanicola sp. S124]
MRRRLRRLRWILLMYEGDRLVGTVALKRVSRRHQRRSFRTAGVSLKPSWRRSELGFLCIDPDYRGQGLSFRIMQEARDRGCRPTYSVTGREGVRKMNAALGMVRRGSPWQGRKEELSLWTWDDDLAPPLETSGES